MVVEWSIHDGTTTHLHGALAIRQIMAYEAADSDRNR